MSPPKMRSPGVADLRGGIQRSKAITPDSTLPTAKNHPPSLQILRRAIHPGTDSPSPMPRLLSLGPGAARHRDSACGASGGGAMNTCTHCGDEFQPKYPNMKLCLPCWKKREIALEEYDDLVEEVESLRYLLNRTPIPQDMLTRLIRLCHPDRHSNSKMANEATQWLLEQRSRIARREAA